MHKIKFSGIVLAAGSGKRMNSDLPKQYMEIDKKPLIYYTLKAFEESLVDEIILVVHEGDISYVKSDIVEKNSFKKVSQIISGGSERIWSVKKGVEASSGDYVLIHDGARAFVSSKLIDEMAGAAEIYQAAVAAVPSKDTIKVSDETDYIKSTPDRNTLWMVQTPQAFLKEKLLKAYDLLGDNKAVTNKITDDASIMEKAGTPVKLIMGEYTNIKVTTSEDLIIGRAIIESDRFH